MPVTRNGGILKDRLRTTTLARSTTIHRQACYEADEASDDEGMDQMPNTAEPGKPRRRWFQFRLRTLLIVVTVAAMNCPIGVWYVRAWQQ